MTQEDITLQQYKLYCEQKDAFIERSFTTNKFYLVMILVVAFVMFVEKDYTLCWGINVPMVFSMAGMLICALWWINMDSYNMLTKIKYRNVIEELEKQLPVQPFGMESTAIKDYRKKQKMFMFQDIQKSFALLALLLFMIIFINNIIPVLMTSF